MRKIISFFVIFLTFYLSAQPVSAAFFPNDQYYHNQWYLDKIQAHNSWGQIDNNFTVTVAVIDSGVEIDHPDLRDNIWTKSKEIGGNGLDDDHNGFADDLHGWDFVQNIPDPSPKFSSDYNDTGIEHGTMVAGIIGAKGNNFIGVAGVGWNVKIMPLRALNEKGEGKVSDVVRAIDYAVNNGADIINLSFVGFSYNENLKEALERAYKAGVIVVAAAGNDRVDGSDGYNTDQTPLYPACYQGDNGENLVIGVAATDALDQKTPFSSYGSCVDISAPGVSYFSAVPYRPDFGDGHFNKYYDGYWSGTSMAAATVSGAFALVKQANPTLSHDQLIRTVLRSTDNIDKINPKYAGRLGTGRLNLASAVSWAVEQLNTQSSYLLISPYSTNYYRNNNFDSHINEIEVAQHDGTDWEKFNYSAAKSKSGLNLASGNFDDSGQSEIAAGTGAGGLPEISVFDVNGHLKNKFLVFDKKYTGGVNIAAGDVNGDGLDEIIAAPAFGAAPLIKIFSGSGKLLKQFSVYDKTQTFGVNIAAGDVNGDGLDEIIAAPATGSNAAVKVFNFSGQLKTQLTPYAKDFKGGVKVAAANLAGRLGYGQADIIVAPQSQSLPQVRIFSGAGYLRGQFMAYDTRFTDGFSISAGDINRDGHAEVITGAAPGGTPHVRVFSGGGTLLESFYAYPDTFDKGVNVGFILVNN